MTSTYTYGNSLWKDQLTAYNGQTITYDKIGNPLTYRDGITFTWQNGRQLASHTKSGYTTTFFYNADGGRDKKISDNGTIQYYYVDGVLLAEVIADLYVLAYLYDESGAPYGVQYRGINDTAFITYYYQYNSKGDIIGLYDSTGTLVVSYTYDPWGKVLSVNDTSTTGIGYWNPLRFKGYYYDIETGLYYLQTRYYDPETGRFINADGQLNPQGLNGVNLYSYCGNDPITRRDVNGKEWVTLFDIFLHVCNILLVAIGCDTAAIGAVFLMMDDPNGSGIYSARFDCWQHEWGYNDLYDVALDIGTSMKKDMFPFSCNGFGYIIWAWKGDYINLGAGAELGIYVGNGPHYKVEYSEAMTMMLGVLYKGENIIMHEPSEKQWWITGFNSNYLNVKASDLTAVFGVIFNNNDMYNAFYGAYSDDKRWTFIPSERGAVFVF